jgi:Asp-tRNA(Asn)/Glu-tRNA(Gln) amidotransferase A subunit family amidase
MPVGPDVLESLISVGHVVTRTVRDSAHFLDATAGPEFGAPYASPIADRPFADAVGRDPGRLRVAVSTRLRAGQRLDPACADAVEKTAALLAELGHEVEANDPDIDLDWLAGAWRRISGVNAHLNLRRREAVLGRPSREDELEPITRLSAEEGGQLAAPDYLATLQEIHAFGRKLAEFHQSYDILLTPTLARQPVPLGELVMTTDDIDDYYDRLFDYISFTPQQNLSGQPAITLPLHWSSEGLPVGVQFAARFGEEATLLSLAAQLEQACPWIDRRPSIWAG